MPISISNTDFSQLGIFRQPALDSSGFFAQAWQLFFQSLIKTQKGLPQYLFQTHAQRLAMQVSTVGLGTLFFETDRQVWYIATATAWQYVFGAFSIIQMGLPMDLGTPDIGFLVNVTDYNHLLVWTAAGFNFAPSDSGSGYTVPFTGVPTNPVGWHVADGSTVNQLNGDGSVSSVTIPTVGGSYFRT